MIKVIKRYLALFLLIGAIAPAVSEGADIVVLMDASGTILPWFDEINSRVLVDITKKFIREGDTFHLISFNSRVNLEIVQPILSEADVSRVVSRFMLLYPLGQNSDFLSGLHYTWQYVSSLDQTRQKVVIVISDGIFNPPADSTYVSYTTEQVKADITQISRQIRGAGWNVYYIKLPFPENAEIATLDGKIVSSPATAKDATKSGKSATKGTDGKDAGAASTTGDTKVETKKYVDVSSEFESSLDIGQSELPKDNVPLTFIDSLFSMPELTFPENLGKKGRTFILPLKVNNVSKNTVNMELTSVYWNDMDVLARASFLNLSPGERGTLRAEIRLPETVSKGPFDLPVRLKFSGGTRVNPQSGTVHMTVVSFSPEMILMSGASLAFSIALIVLAAVLVFFLIVFVVRKTARPVTDAVSAASSTTASSSSASVTSSTDKGRVTQTETTVLSSARHAKSMVGFKSATPDAVTSREAATVLSSTGKPSDSGYSALSGYETQPKVDRKATLDSMAVKEDKQIHFTVTKDETALQNVSKMASELAAENNARSSILSEAAKKYTIHEAVRTGASSDEPIAIRESGSIMLELAVGNQNPHIGKRNVHMMKAGSRLSIGGGRSAFLIFLVKFPANIAEIRFDGKQCSLAILKPQFFPYESENVIHDCVGKDFILVSDKGYEVAFSLKVYEDPLLKLNRLLQSII